VLDLAFKDGALSANVRQRLRERKAELKQKLTGQRINAASTGEPTKFSSITAKASIKNGVVSNDDLEVRARHMLVTGKGLFKLPNNYIDYVLTILLSDDGAGQSDPLNDLYDFPIEYHLKGKLEELDYAGAATKALGNAVKAKLKKEVQDKKAAAKAEYERARQEAEAKKRAELARKQQEAREAAQRELEKKKEEAKNKLLRKLFD
jgi:hypothetical protein